MTLTRPKDINKISLLEFLSRLMMAVPDCIKTQELCNEAVEEEPGLLGYTPNCLKNHEICNKAVTDVVVSVVLHHYCLIKRHHTSSSKGGVFTLF